MSAAMVDHPGPKLPATSEARGGSTTSNTSLESNDIIKPENAKDDTTTDLEKLRSGPDALNHGEVENDPFGAGIDGGTNYKTLQWWRAGALLIAETISLGILSLPKVIATVGFLPGVLLIAGIGLMATYTGYIVGKFKQKHMGLHSFAHAAAVIFGPVGRWVVEIAQILILVFIMAAHILTFSVEMNVLTNHGTCTIVFGIIGTIVSLILTLPRTFKGISGMSVVSCISITAAIIITMIGVGIKHPAYPETYLVTPSNMTSFQQGVVSVSNIVVAYAGHVAFFGFISEMQQPRDFPKALALLQTVAISFYVVVAVVIYRYVGHDVTSPALTSASPTVAKVAWGVAMPTIIVAGVVNASIAAKNMYVRIWHDWRGQRGVMSEKSARSYGSWAAICALLWALAWLIASAIPVFSDLLGLLGALFCSWFTLGLPSVFWFWMYKGRWFEDWSKRLQFVLNTLIFLICCVICVAGTYGSAREISAKTNQHGSFSCADNSK